MTITQWERSSITPPAEEWVGTQSVTEWMTSRVGHSHSHSASQAHWVTDTLTLNSQVSNTQLNRHNYNNSNGDWEWDWHWDWQYNWPTLSNLTSNLNRSLSQCTRYCKYKCKCNSNTLTLSDWHYSTSKFESLSTLHFSLNSRMIYHYYMSADQVTNFSQWNSSVSSQDYLGLKSRLWMSSVTVTVSKLGFGSNSNSKLL